MIRIISDFIEQRGEIISVLMRIAIVGLFWSFYWILKRKQ